MIIVAEFTMTLKQENINDKNENVNEVYMPISHTPILLEAKATLAPRR